MQTAVSKKMSGPVAAIVLCGAAMAQAPYATSVEAAAWRHEIPANRGSAALWQTLKKLQTRASLAMITAHPDDEDGGMLTYESRGRGTRVALLTLNRGEGGANVMSPDFFDALGLVRTMEFLESGRHYGVEQFFTRVTDYGFSKTAAESAARWTKERVLADLVRLIRITRPLVLASVFVGGPSDGHGNHQMAGVLTHEAFAAAGDPGRFPEQIRAGLKPWMPLKQYARTPWFGRSDSKLAVHVTVPQGTYDPLLGVSYAHLAREGLGYQKSQTGGAYLPKPGPVTSTYHRFASRIAAADREQSFFDGIDVSLGGMATLARGASPAFLTRGLAAIQAAVERAAAEFDATAPARCAGALAEGAKATAELLAAVESSHLSEQARYDIRHELRIKQAQFNSALALALGVTVNATLAPEGAPGARTSMFGDAETPRAVVPGQKLKVSVRIAKTSAVPVRLVSVRVHPEQWGDGDPASAPTLDDTGVADLVLGATIPADAPYTRPYFTRDGLNQSYYSIDEAQFGRPLPPYPLAVWADFEYAGVNVRAGEVVQTVKRVTGMGAVYEPLVVGPELSVSISPRVAVAPLGSASFPVRVTVESNAAGSASGMVRLELPEGWRARPEQAEFRLNRPGERMGAQFSIEPHALGERRYRIAAVATSAGKEFREGYTTPGYPGIRTSYLFREAVVQAAGVDAKIAPGLRVAYITGTGDEVPESLRHFGIEPVFLSASDVATADLSGFHAVVLGVRAYAAREELKANSGRILDYVRGGGVAIVQYNTPEYDRNYGPYPYSMGANPEEVTDENSRVTILAPEHPVFRWPNRITERDFEGWVEQRGSKWMSSWDPRWTPLLETHDQDQPPQKGGFLYAEYGKGVYIYNGYAFYRQMPEGVPGAYRIFANLLSLGQNPLRNRGGRAGIP